MAYDPTVIDAFNRALADARATPKVRKALFQAGIVESGLRNLDFGDADSLGPLQQRPGAGWKNATDPYKGALDFIHQAAELNATGQYGSAGQLAAAVQRPRSDLRGKYSAVPNSTLAPLLGGASSASSPGSLTPAAAGPSGSGQQAAPSFADPGQAGDFTGLLGQLLGGQQQQAPQTMAVAPPQFSAQAPMPQGFKAPTPEAQQAPAQQGTVSSNLSLLGSLQGAPPTLGPSATTEGANGSQVEKPSPVVQTVSQQRSGEGPTAALGWAKSYLGFKETGENEGGIASYANQRFGMAKQPWCAMFTSLAITKGGAPLEARTASVGEVRRKALQGAGYVKGFVSPDAAKAGDLILFGDDHIGMVDHVSGGRVSYVGGNQSDGVTMASVPVGQGDIVRPKYGARAVKAR